MGASELHLESGRFEAASDAVGEVGGVDVLRPRANHTGVMAARQTEGVSDHAKNLLTSRVAMTPATIAADSLSKLLVLSLTSKANMSSRSQ